MSLNGISPIQPGKQEAHVFNFYTMRKRLAAAAAMGAMVLAGALQTAMAQGSGGAAAPAKNYKPGEYELYDSAAKAIGAKNFTKAIADIDSWKQKTPQSDYSPERSVLAIQAYSGAQQWDKVLAEAGTLMSQDLDKQFPDAASGPGQVLQALVHSTTAIQQIKEPTQAQLDTAQKAATMLKGYDRKPSSLADAQWQQAKDGLRKAADAALLYIAVVPGANAVAKNNCESAQNLLSKAASDFPQNAYVAYQLGLAYRCTVKAAPAKMEEVQPKAIYQFVRALVLDPSLGGTQDAKKMSELLANTYTGYHGSTEGLEEPKAQVKQSALPPANFTIKSITRIAEEKQKEFESKYPQLAMWLGIKSQLAGAEGPAYFEGQLKNAAVPKLKGMVVEGKPACRSKELLVSVPEPDQQNAPTVITLKLDAALTGKPTAGEIQWEGVPSAFTAEPFMLTMDTEKAKVEGLQVTPCTTAPARPAGKKGATPKKK
jgi:hypothetical protein